MSRWLLIVMIMLLPILSGCILDYALSNIQGWNLSACVSGYETCWELFTDNQDRILGGRNVIDVVLDPYIN